MVSQAPEYWMTFYSILKADAKANCFRTVHTAFARVHGLLLSTLPQQPRAERVNVTFETRALRTVL